MTAPILNVLPCPFCGTDEPTVVINLGAVRATSYSYDTVSQARLAHRAVSFRDAPAGPCPHLIYLQVDANWERRMRREGNPTGKVVLEWKHPSIVDVAWEESGWGPLVERAIPGPMTSRRRRLAVAEQFRFEGFHQKGVVEGKPTTRSWQWTIAATALFTSNLNVLNAEPRSTLPTQLTGTGSTAGLD